MSKLNKIANVNVIIDNIKNKIIELDNLEVNAKIIYSDMERHLGLGVKVISNYKARGMIPFIAILEWCNKLGINSDDIFFNETVTYCVNDSCGVPITSENIMYNKKDGKYIKMGKCRACVNADAVARYQKRIKDREAKKARSKYCSIESCNALLTEENTKVITYTTKDGTVKTSKLGKCKSCINEYVKSLGVYKNADRSVANKKKKQITKKTVTKKEVEVKIDPARKLTTREKMQMVFDEQENRRLATKKKGEDSKLLNPFM